MHVISFTDSINFDHIGIIKKILLFRKGHAYLHIAVRFIAEKISFYVYMSIKWLFRQLFQHNYIILQYMIAWKYVFYLSFFS